MAKKKSSQYEALVKEYKRLAWNADKKLQRLEAQAKKEKQGAFLKFAYARAMEDIRHWSGEGHKRFTTAPPRTTQELRAKMKDIKSFIEAPTSTTLGIRRVYKERVKTINEEYGTNFNWKTFGDFLNSSMWKKADRHFDSGTVLEAIGKIQEKKSDIVKQMKAGEIPHVTLDGDIVLEDAVNDILKSAHKRELRQFLK